MSPASVAFQQELVLSAMHELRTKEWLKTLASGALAERPPTFDADDVCLHLFYSKGRYLLDWEAQHALEALVVRGDIGCAGWRAYRFLFEVTEPEKEGK